LQLTYFRVITISICWGILVGEGNNLGSLVIFTHQSFRPDWVLGQERKNGHLNLEVVQINFNPLSIGFASCVSNNTIKNLWAINVTRKPNSKVVDA
jgi:hypothetical protein